MKLERFEAQVQKELKLLRTTTLLVGSLFVFIFILVLFEKHEFYFDRGNFIKERDLGASVCHDSFMGIVNRKPPSDLIMPNILNELKKTNFDVSVDDVLATYMIETNKCQLITKSGRQIRTFLIELAANKKFRRYYKLASVEEIELSTETINKLAKEMETK